MKKELGLFEEAETHYLKAKRRMERDGDLHLQFGHLYKLMGRLDEAVAAYEQAAVLLQDRQDVASELAAARVLSRQTPRERIRDRLRAVMKDTVEWQWYILANPDLEGMSIDPTEHYLLHGWSEGRSLGGVAAGKDLSDVVWRDGLPSD